MIGRLSEKAAVITGAARGIGYATARLFAREGARLGLIDHDATGLEQSAKAKGAVPCLLGRWEEADEIAFPILWLASGEASFITGVAPPVDGGIAVM